MNRIVTTTRWVERGGLLRSPLLGSLGLVAGFTTRRWGTPGGRSEAAVRDMGAVARDLGFDAIRRVRQVHGSSVVRADGPLEVWPEADALWTDRSGLLLGIGVADCVPVLVADAAGPIGAAHAGWQGTTLRVTEALVRAMVASGASPDRMVAALGPSIGPCCYVIDGDRAAIVRERLGAEVEEFLHSAEPAGGSGADASRLVFDLWAENLAQLRAAGITTVETAGICTKCGGEDLWSYRARDRLGLGTGLAVIGRPRGVAGAEPPRRS